MKKMSVWGSLTVLSSHIVNEWSYHQIKNPYHKPKGAESAGSSLLVHFSGLTFAQRSVQNLSAVHQTSWFCVACTVDEPLPTVRLYLDMLTNYTQVLGSGVEAEVQVDRLEKCDITAIIKHQPGVTQERGTETSYISAAVWHLRSVFKKRTLPI